MDSSNERWKKIKQQALREKIDITRISAVDGRLLNSKDYINNSILHPNHTLSLGQLGCALSHIKTLQLIEKKDSSIYHIILEDDVIIPANILYKLNSIVETKLPDADIHFLGGCNVKGNLVNKQWIKPNVFDASYNLCCHAMMISPTKIPKILNILQPLYSPIDNQLRDSFENHLDVYYLHPFLIQQDKRLKSIRRKIDGKPDSLFWIKHHNNVKIV